MEDKVTVPAEILNTMNTARSGSSARESTSISSDFVENSSGGHQLSKP
jgi:hypothetical protein